MINNYAYIPIEDRYKSEDAFAKSIEMVYDIKEVTTSRQLNNGTRSFVMPTGERIACYKSGYVRKYCNGRWYQINRRYLKETRWTVMNERGDLTTKRSMCRECELIHNPLARMKYMLEFYLKNYKKQTMKRDELKQLVMNILEGHYFGRNRIEDEASEDILDLFEEAMRLLPNMELRFLSFVQETKQTIKEK